MGFTNKQRKEKEWKTKMQKAKNGWSPFFDVIGLRSTMPNDLSHVLFNSCSYSWTSGISTKQLILKWHGKVIQFGLDNMIPSQIDRRSFSFSSIHTRTFTHCTDSKSWLMYKYQQIFQRLFQNSQWNISRQFEFWIPIHRVPTVIGMNEKESKK